jgi:hypothetical protein
MVGNFDSKGSVSVQVVKTTYELLEIWKLAGRPGLLIGEIPYYDPQKINDKKPGLFNGRLIAC